MNNDVAILVEHRNCRLQLFAAMVFPLALAARYVWVVLDPVATRDWDAALIVIMILELPLLIVRAIAVRIVDSGDTDAISRVCKFLFGVFGVLGVLAIWLHELVQATALSHPNEVISGTIGLTIMILNNATALLVVRGSTDLDRARGDAVIADWVDQLRLLYSLLLYALCALVPIFPILLFTGVIPDSPTADQQLFALRQVGFSIAALYFFLNRCCAHGRSQRDSLKLDDVY